MAVVGLTRPASGFGKGTAMFATAATIELNGLLWDSASYRAVTSCRRAQADFLFLQMAAGIRLRGLPNKGLG